MGKSITPEEIKNYNRGLWKLLIGSMAFFAIFIVLIGFGLFGEIPSFRTIEHPKSNEATEIISEDGKIIGTYFVKNRSNVNYSQISPNVINALIATEDIRFLSHSGIDFKRTFTIFLYTLTGKKTRWKYNYTAISPQLIF
jgi:penicillin-binding protein 1A